MIEPGRAGRDELRRDRLRDEIRRAHVERHDRIVLILGDVEERHGIVDAGVVDQDVVGLSRGDQLARTRRVGDIEFERFGTMSAGDQRSHGRVEILGRARGQRDVRTKCCQRLRCSETDPAAGACDQSALAVETEGRDRFGADGLSLLGFGLRAIASGYARRR